MCLASIVMTDAAPTSIVHFATAPAETTQSKPAPERLLSGDPRQVVRNYFSDSTGQFFAGVWESTPGRWRVSYTESEFCCITRGRVRIEDAHGAAWTFTVGDAFVIPAGFAGVWEVLEPTTKFYAIFEASK
jgi:uncharacterized protein